MMLQINLLPEARILKLKDMTRKRTAATITILTILVVGTVIATLVLLLGYEYSINRATQLRIESLKKDINSKRDLEQKSATLQENLAAFATQQKSRLYVSEIFRNLGSVIPANVKISSFQISDDYLVTVSGTAPSFAAVSTFSEALQQYNVNFKPQANLERKQLFTDVKITSVSRDSNSPTVSFTMTFKVDPTLFNSGQVQ